MIWPLPRTSEVAATRAAGVEIQAGFDQEVSDGALLARRHGAGHEGTGSDSAGTQQVDQLVGGGGSAGDSAADDAALEVAHGATRHRGVVRSTAARAVAPAHGGGRGGPYSDAVPRTLCGFQRPALPRDGGARARGEAVLLVREAGAAGGGTGAQGPGT